MKHLPRALNRFLLFLIGLVFLAVGVILLLVSFCPAAKDIFKTSTKRLAAGYQRLYDQSLVAIPGLKAQDFSWLSIAWITLAIILALLLLGWIFSQGGGKVKELNLFGTKNEHPDQGEVVAKLSFVDDLIQDVLSEDRWIADVKTTAWEVKKQPGLALSVVAYKGADLNHLKKAVDQAIARVDSVLESALPISVHFTTNWRTTFQSADRVDS